MTMVIAAAVRRAGVARFAVAALGLGALGLGAPGAGTLGVESLAAQEAPPSTPVLATWPSESAWAQDFFRFRGRSGARVLQGGLGLLMAAGGPLPASPSTAGQRLHGSPRIVADGGLAVVRVNLPALEGSGATDHDRTSVLLAPRVTVAAGVFEGFSPAPTVGGVGSVDVVAELRYLPLLAPNGLDGASIAWGLGARVGVLRESFTLPGVTLVGMHRRTGSTGYRGPEQPMTLEGGETVIMHEVVELSPSVTSLRAVVGKDLLAVGVNAGVQRDWIRGDALVDVRQRSATGGSGNPMSTTASTTSVPVDRTTWFVGANRTWVVTQATLELGWSPAAGGPADPGTLGFPAYRGPEGAFSGAISFRITY
ncbi:MAG: hypothetical protein EA350_00820 [Gemmatimonadales bacterium]|nr:MAG: hypothetical protein EA350_00820 [Gemmatimonadales bacterium]